MAVRKLVQPSGTPAPKAAYSPGIKISGKSIIFVSGQLPVDPSGALVGDGDFRAQVTQVFENIQDVLKAANASFNDVVKLNYYITDIGNFPIIQEVRVRYLTTPYPASTLVEVSAFVNPKAMVEIEAIAVT